MIIIKSYLTQSMRKYELGSFKKSYKEKFDGMVRLNETFLPEQQQKMLAINGVCFVMPSIFVG